MREDVTTEAEVGAMQGHKPRNAAFSSNWQRPGNRFSPRVSRRNAVLLTL